MDDIYGEFEFDDDKNIVTKVQYVHQVLTKIPKTSVDILYLGFMCSPHPDRMFFRISNLKKCRSGFYPSVLVPLGMKKKDWHNL